MKPWHDQLARSITTPRQLEPHFELADDALRACETFPLQLTPYVLSLSLRSEAVARQFVPDGAELADSGRADPLREEAARPVPGIIHRYPNRLLLIASDRCAANCRFCTRKGRIAGAAANSADEGVEYIRSKPEVRQVILSGGDPMMLEDEALVGLLEAVRSIDHVRVLRIHTRIPSTLPMRITHDLCRELGRLQPLYVIVQFNHPDELTDEAIEACGLMANAGVPLGNQSVLLRGVNDEPHVMQMLMRRLLEARVRPYYIHHPDGTRGTRHFDVDTARGLAIMNHLRASCSGLAVPQYVKDAPDAPFKRPLG